jgi:predicted nucleic acid-binding protein
MKRDARKHILIDANVLSAYLAPKTHRDPAVYERSKILIDSAVKYGWPTVQLYTPTICVAETQCVLDKHRYCDWHGAPKDPQYRLTKAEYSESLRQLDHLLEARQLIRVEISHDHIAASALVSVPNAKYQYRRESNKKAAKKRDKSRIKPPMGAADCLIAGMAVDLSLRVGADDVVILTADRRLSDIMTACRTLTDTKARNLDLLTLAKRLNTKWSNVIYPRAINIAKCTEKELKGCLGGWPLPEREVCEKRCENLTNREQKELYDLGQQIKSEYGVGPDSLPYTAELDDLQIRFAIKTGVYSPRAEIARQLLAWRKNVKSRPT